LLLEDAESAADLCTRLQRWRARPDEFRDRTRRAGAIFRARTWDDMAREIADLTES
jgi:hypothetical protein